MTVKIIHHSHIMYCIFNMFRQLCSMKSFSFIHIERSLMTNEPDNVETGFLIVLLGMNEVIELNIGLRLVSARAAENDI